MTNISRKTYERKGIETVVDNDGILRLNEKDKIDQIIKICEKSQQNIIQIIKKHRYELLEEKKKKSIEYL